MTFFLAASLERPERVGSPGARGLAATIGAHASLLLTAALLAAALVPTVLTPIPAMVDYVNHLARMYLLAADASDASPFYRVTWGLYPNLAMDLVVPRLAQLTGVETATRLFLLASQVLIVTGAGALELAVKRRLAIAGPIAVLFLFSVPFAWGFMNFEFALGMALWGIAAWIALAQRSWGLRLLVHAVVVFLLFFGHFFALGIYGFTLGVHELWSAWRRRPSPAALVATTVLLAAPAVIVLSVMVVAGGAIGGEGSEWELAMKPLWLSAILDGYSLGASRTEAAGLVVLACLLVRAGSIRPVASGAWLAAGLMLLFVAVPSRLMDTAFSDLRVLVAAALILPAFVDITFSSARWRTAAAGVVAGFALVNVGITTIVFQSYAGTYRTMIASFATLGTGARVLVGHSGAGEDPPMTHLVDYPLYHAPTLAAHYAKAFVPTLFTTTGKQPLTVVPAVRDLAFSCRGPVSVSILATVASGRSSATAPSFLRHWTSDFDYLYVIGDGKAPNPLPNLLVPVTIDARFALYRIEKAHEINGRGEIGAPTVTQK